MQADTEPRAASAASIRAGGAWARSSPGC